MNRPSDQMVALRNRTMTNRARCLACAPVRRLFLDRYGQVIGVVSSPRVDHRCARSFCCAGLPRPGLGSDRGLTLARIGLAFPRLGLSLPWIGLTLRWIGLTLPPIGLTLPRIGLTLRWIDLTLPRIGLTLARRIGLPPGWRVDWVFPAFQLELRCIEPPE